MSRLRVLSEAGPAICLLETKTPLEIHTALQGVGILFQRWAIETPILPGTPEEECMELYSQTIKTLKDKDGYQAADVVSMNPVHPQKKELREKFLKEHTHADDEVRLFVSGSGLFGLHLGNRVYEIICMEGDFISIPKGIPHWFDMGPEPSFVCIRLFRNPEGWHAIYTGSDIASRFNQLVP